MSIVIILLFNCEVSSTGSMGVVTYVLVIASRIEESKCSGLHLCRVGTIVGASTAGNCSDHRVKDPCARLTTARCHKQLYLVTPVYSRK